MPERRRLTRTFVDKLEARELGEYIVWDTEVERLGVRVHATGLKVYTLRLRLNTRQRWISIGRHGDPWDPEGARTESLRLMTAAAHGEDPTSERVRLKEL